MPPRDLIKTAIRNPSFAEHTLLARLGHSPPSYAILECNTNEVEGLLTLVESPESTTLCQSIPGLSELKDSGFFTDDFQIGRQFNPTVTFDIGFEGDWRGLVSKAFSIAPENPTNNCLIATKTSDIIVTLGGTCTSSSLDSHIVRLNEILAECATRAAELTAPNGDHPELPNVFLRTTFVEENPALIDLLLNYSNLSLIHVVDRESRHPDIPLSEEPLLIEAAARVAQSGIPVAIELCAEKTNLQFLSDEIKDWIQITRGGGLILRGNADDLTPQEYAELLLQIYDLQLIPADRFAPINMFVESLGGTRTAIPFSGPPDATAFVLSIDNGSCPWRFICSHWCNCASHDNEWHRTVAALLYQRLIETLGETLLARNATQPPAGERLRVMIKDGKMVFMSEEVKNGIQIAPDPKTLVVPTNSTGV